ncbi:hypothetical protein COS52_04660 [Candidatus Roizmanbacteria bacterium CG03_land_8_20_14_0_80_39_12]|uniref:Methionyl-tRNA formyltransferase n=1 Tax=Candidatus Roizmanbacteria bacterium CG03_land_8_20_14_0_80_39_12 TaxID=1974847 RepID=A0A2M7BRK7_9BACT|nr:MAG: hypothetical protein COS52_04660 [Candidatus Roizmanbacteria bacterium CG03_land_8_20_14_0_80_39_12]
MKKLNIAFFGAPSFAARVLQRIIDDKNLPITVVLVVTQPDRPAGRKQISTSTPVKLLAQKHGIPVFDSFQLPTFSFQLKQIDLVLLYAYGAIIPSDILKIPRWGFWNIHPSLLPKYRGASPIAYSLLMGDKTTGVSLIQMDERMDHGPILSQQTYEIQKEDTREDLENKLSDIGYELFKQSVQLLINGTLQKVEQNNSNRTFTRLLTKQDGYIPFPIVQKIIKRVILKNNEIPPIITEYCNKYQLTTNHPSTSLRVNQPLTTYYDLFRGLSPWPGLWTVFPINGIEKRLKITRMTLSTNHPSTSLRVNQPLRPKVWAKGPSPFGGYRPLGEITHVQLEGKKEVSLETFQKAYGSFLNI